MESLSVLLNAPFAPSTLHSVLVLNQRNPCSQTRLPLRSRHFPPVPPLSAVKTPKGFGPSPSKKKGKKRRNKSSGGVEEEEKEEEVDGDDEDGEQDETIPEVVTNRMMRRMGLSVGLPLVVGLLFFPLFYYLKTAAKADVPNWVPVLVSFFFFGTALLGVSYGIVSSSWDPMREGSLLGWNEAQRNWPVFWQSLWGANSSSRRPKL